ncbi:MAG TPA: CbtB-domain containing protein [Candidatus Binatia bacterium]|nr:CbtB-domain containing protein [Candidatus Binatia bacterium]
MSLRINKRPSEAGRAAVNPWTSASLAVAALLALYVLALDQGLLLSFVQGPAAFDMNLIHEFVHDARHAAGFPCH